MDAQFREQNRAKQDRIGLIANQLGVEDRNRIQQHGRRSLLAGLGGGAGAPASALGGIVPALASGGKGGLLGALFGLPFSLFGR